MTYRALCAAVLLMVANALCVADDRKDVAAVLDDFHDAAAQADKHRYLNHLLADGVFMGTDERERWPKPVFTDYVSKRFKKDRGWQYRSVERNIMFTADANVAWFDEVIFSEKNGRFRGTGVLLKHDGVWKIAQYAMSFLILNENWVEVRKLTRETRLKKEGKK